MLARSILCLGLIVPLQLLSQPLLAQTSLPACTAEIADVDGDQTNDNDGAAGIIDIDKDGDGLIEICDLEGLNEIRYQLDGSSYKASADATIITQGCPSAGCRGYELVKDLDFNADASYRTISNKVTWIAGIGSGWLPIGSDSNRFSSVFEGNGYTIAHLYIKRTNDSDIGLFAVTDDTAQINNIKLSDVNVQGGNDTGSLVGRNSGSIISIDVTGTVNGGTRVGGLVGQNSNQISLSFATVMVTGRNSIGGLVGANSHSITNCYAIGTVSGNGWIGGLVGLNDGRITNSYAIGRTNGSVLTGGLVSDSLNNQGSATASYWDTDTTRQPTSTGGEGRTTVQLQSPLAPGYRHRFAETVTYYGWSNEVWYFGSTNTYPVLRFTVDADGDGILDGDADNRIDIDQDGDGLIEIYDLEGLNEIRYQLDGSGYRASADATKITRGCPATGCRGYELMKDLDFNKDDSYRSAASNKTAWTAPNAAGWQPIGDSSDGFSSVLEGNGHTIAHLYINRGDEFFVGLLAFVDPNAQIQNIRLLDVNVKGDNQVGSLAGSNNGIIINVRVTGTVSAKTSVGGLTGHNAKQIISSFANVTVTASQNSAGGLVGGNSITNRGSVAFISESVASGNVMGDQFVGGLSGRNWGNIINSYATGSATGRDSVGGLIGLCNTNCIIANTYATGTVMGTSTVGGLVGDHSGLVIASYWDTQTSDQSASPGGDPKTTAELQSPTAPGATAIATYYGWSADIWDFGNNTEYPLLRVSVADPDTDGDMVLDVTDIDDDNDGLIEVHTIDDLHEIRFQNDGSGKKQHANDANNTTGCPPLGCIGYELARSLDFNNVNSYRDYRINTEWTVADYADNTDRGWHPLPGFRAIFNGNGHIISNLQINRVNHNDAGLFGVLELTGRIEHVELVYPNVRGQSNVGGLVGQNKGVISNSYVRDYDTDPNSRNATKLIEAIEGSVGGLVGRNNGGGTNIGYIINSGAVIDVQIKEHTSDAGISANAGGLVGFNTNGAEIHNSYARGDVKGPCGVGGLTANNHSTDNVDPEKNSKIINSYATGTVTTGFGNCDRDINIRSGGLAAINNGLISNSYTTSCWANGTSGRVNGRRGGVVQSNNGTINNSYYQTGCGSLQQTPSGSNRTQNQLRQLPTESNLYSEWSVNEWDFGTSNQYPLIRYTAGFDKDNPECGALSLPACNALIKHQGRTATDAGSPATNPSFVSGLIGMNPSANAGAFILQPPQFDLANSQYKLYIQDTRTDTSAMVEYFLLFRSLNYAFSNCLTDPNDVGSTASISCNQFLSVAQISIDKSHTFTFDIEDDSTNPDTVYRPFSLEVIPVATPRLFTSNNILDDIIAVDKIASFTLEPREFDTDITDYTLHVQDIRTNTDQQMHIRLMLSSSYEFWSHSCGTNITSLSDGQGSIDCPSSLIPVGDNSFNSVWRELNSKFNREHTISFGLTAFDDNKTYSIQIIPDILFSSVSVIVDSEVNGEPATFIDDSAVMRVKEGDTVRMNVADSFVVRDGINLPLSYHWYSSSGPTLISGELRGKSISFDIGDTMFRDSGSGDAIVTLEVRDQSGTAATPVIQEIPIRIFGRLSLTSDAAEVMRDPADKTLHRVVLAPDQSQAIITARALNETLTVDDSDGKVSAKNGDGTSLASEITVQLEVGSKVEFTIIATDSDGTAVTHTVRVFRRSGSVSLQDIEIADITFDETISAPGSYVGMLPIGMKNTTITQITLTAGETNAISIVTVSSTGQEGTSTYQITADKDFADPGTELILTRSRGDGLNVEAGGIISLTVRTRDAYIDETRASATLADLPYDEGVYTITIENTQIIDDDNDGLIDIYTLEDLDEIRNQYTNMPSTCGSNGNITCEGFELRRSLDFNAADSYEDDTINTAWTTGLGWPPILASDFSPFNRVFEGNGLTISGLYIDNNIGFFNGLFPELHADGVIKNVGLLDVSIRGDAGAGSLVSENQGTIINSYVTTATIVGSFRIGGLVGGNHGTIINSYVTTATIVGSIQIGGLVGFNKGDIISSFAYADVIGSTEAYGGLVGVNEGKIINTYAAGTVASTVASTQTVTIAGGLVGWDSIYSEIRNSYTISRVRPLTDGDSRLGGLVGEHQLSIQNSITASYWDKTVNADLAISDGAKTTAELQNPTMPGATSADTYHGWDTEAWDFGDRSHYPTLYYATTDSITVSACADNPPPLSTLPRCGSRIPNQAIRNLIPDLPDLEVSEITINAQPAANADGTINEGSNVSLMVNATGGSESYSYTWSQTSGRTLELENSTSTILSFTIPPDLVELDATTAAITFQVEVNDGSLTIRRSAIITIQKIDNGSFSSANADITPTQLRIIPTGTDPDGVGVFSYQWQQQELGGEWEDINDATMATYSLPTDVSASVHYRVTISYTDDQGYTTDYIQGPFKATFDDDNDRLIDIYTLEDLDEIRHQYRNMPTRCGSSGDIACNGFELRRSLDFNAVESYQSGMIDPNWTTSTGWTPIGSAAFNERFNRVFEGNDFTISGLYINRPRSPNVGLFGVSHSEIKNIGLLDVNIIGRNNVGGLVGWRSSSAIINSYTSGTVSGRNSVGGLAGFNNGSILNSYTSVAVTATAETVGGLVGVNRGSILNSYASGAVSGVSHVGGLSGQNRGRANIINSYATGAVTATNAYIGGLVGWSEVGTHIINSYASGAVSGGQNVGGLVGWHQGRLRNVYATGDVLLTSTSDNDLGGLIGDWSGQKNSISNSYAIGRVIPGVDNARNAGGLIGATTGTAISSYWDSETSGWNMSAGGVTSRTTIELQSPTTPGATAMDIYYGWDNNDWDFGNSEAYPALRYVAGGMNACNTDMSTPSELPQCGSLLPNQERIGQVALAVSEVTVSSQPMANVDGTINEGSNVSLMVNATGGSRAYNFAWSQTSGKALVLTTTNTATLNVAIPPDFITEDAATTMLTFTVMVDDGMSTISRSRMITITKASLTISGVMLSAATIAEGSTATVTFDVSGGTGIYQYGYKLIAGADEIALPSLTPPAVLVMPADIVAAADSDRVVELNIIVSDDRGRRVEHNEELTIQKIDNGLANIEASRATSRTLTVKVGSDPDGDATTLNYQYQWQWRAAGGTAQWVNISGENDASYTITDDLAVINNEFRVQITYTDGQGYKEIPTSNEISYIPLSELPPLIVSNIMLSFQPPANADGTINEGSMATLTFDVSSGTGVYQYASKIDDAAGYTPFELPFMYSIADDFIATNTTSQTVRLTIRVSDQADKIFEHTEELHIRKTNNGSADINISITSATLTATIGADPDGDPNPTSYTYQWQTKTGAEWMNIDSATDISYTISGDLTSAGGEFRVQITYTDGQGYKETLTSNEIRYTPPGSGLRVRTKVFLEGPLR